MLPIEKLGAMLADTMNRLGYGGNRGSGSTETMNHTGTIRVEGVSDKGQTIEVVDIVMDKIRRERRT